MQPPRPARGFTLVELLTVIAIIGILAAILIPTVGKVRESARTASTLSTARQLSAALLLYVGDNRGEFPYADIGTAAPSGQRYWPRRLNDSLGIPPNASRGVFLAASDRVTRRDNNLGPNANIATTFSGHNFLFGQGTYNAATGTVTRNAFPPVQRLTSLRRPSETIMIVTGQPLVNFNETTGQSDGATATFSHRPFGAWNAPAATLDDPLERLGNANGWEDIGYFVGDSGTAIVNAGTRTMSTNGTAVAGMVDGSVRQFRLGEIRVRHVNLIH